LRDRLKSDRLLASAKVAHASLVTKAAEAAGKVKALEAQRDSLRVLVMRGEEATIIARVKAADAACQAERDVLEAFLGLHVGSSLFPAAPDAVVLFHTWPTTPQRPIGGGALTPLVQPFAALFAKLGTDADAQLDQPISAQPPDPVLAMLKTGARRLMGA